MDLISKVQVKPSEVATHQVRQHKPEVKTFMSQKLTKLADISKLKSFEHKMLISSRHLSTHVESLWKESLISEGTTICSKIAIFNNSQAAEKFLKCVKRPRLWNKKEEEKSR